jgi:hypothetical protein
MSLQSSAMDAAPYPSQGFVSVAVTASLGAVLAIGDGIVPINDSMASIRGPRNGKGSLEPSRSRDREPIERWI